MAHTVKMVIYGHVFSAQDLNSDPSLARAAAACDEMPRMAPGDATCPMLGTGYDEIQKLYWIGAVRFDGYADELFEAAAVARVPIGMEQAKLANLMDACPEDIQAAFARFPAAVAIIGQMRECRNDVLMWMNSDRLTQAGRADRVVGHVPQQWIDARRLDGRPRYSVELRPHTRTWGEEAPLALRTA